MLVLSLELVMTGVRLGFDGVGIQKTMWVLSVWECVTNPPSDNIKGKQMLAQPMQSFSEKLLCYCC